MSEESREQLLPCPFCGCKRVNRLSWENADEFYVICHDCKAKTRARFKNSKDAINAWNKRDPNPSDGYHTMQELYHHRYVLFFALLKGNPEISWRANIHDDGSSFGDEYFIAGMHLPTGDISYHLPSKLWKMLDGLGITTTNKAPKWDGHTSDDVIERIKEWVEQKS